MTQKEAIDELMHDVEFAIYEVDQHEKFKDEEQDPYQIESYENYKRRLEAYLTIFGALDPELSTLSALRNHAKKVSAKNGLSYDESDEPGEIEEKLVKILSPWCKKTEKETGYAAEFELTDEENSELAKINLEQGGRQVIVEDDDYDDDVSEASEDDVFTFYTYRGRVQVIYDGYADTDFCSYSEKFQEKAYEIIKAKINE